ncbi:hypothetical protein DL98DRAFT_652046 [Cadophora sp. DSE1049]|nr:hypothetical protein DL98DRAFT_652046 [Cadophora sp. DSE1049]
MTAIMQDHGDERPPTEMQREDPTMSQPASSNAEKIEQLGNTEAEVANDTAADSTTDMKYEGSLSSLAQEAGGGGAGTESRSQADRQSPSTVTLHSVAKNDKAHKALHIPNEILFMILRLLPLRDILSVRLISKPFSELGAGMIFRPFVFKPHRDDFARIKAVAARPHLVAGIKSIRFESGTMDIFHIVAELAAEWSQTYDMLTGTAKYMNTETRKRSAILEYARWNSAWRSLRQDYKDLDLLVSVFQKLPSLNSVVISRKACSFKNNSLVNAFAEGSLTSNFERANEEFAVVLAAIDVCMGDRLTSLSHDELPVTFFTQYSSIMVDFTQSLQYLGILHLTFDATEPPLISFWKGFGVVLRSASRLVDLRFGFNPLARWAAVEGAWCFSEEPENWYLPLWKLLGRFTFRQLKRLRLDGLLLCETGLVELLMRHRGILQHLHLHHTGLWEGSFRNLLSSLRDGITLRSFDISGHTQAFHAWHEHWRIKPAKSPIPDPCPTGMRYYTIREYQAFAINPPFSYDGISDHLNQFVLLHKDWKLGKEHAHTEPDDEPHSPDCEGCWSIDRDEINKEWDASGEENLDTWEESVYNYLVPGEDCQPDDDVCEAYGEDGYDDDGFNRFGFHESGHHYTNPLIQPDDGSIADGAFVALKKELIKEIKRNIPRYK